MGIIIYTKVESFEGKARDSHLHWRLMELLFWFRLCSFFAEGTMGDGMEYQRGRRRRVS